MLFALIGAMAAVIGSSPDIALADNVLVASTPADGATLDEPPGEIVLDFEDEVGSTNQIEVTCGNRSADAAIEQPVISDDRRSITVGVSGPLPEGACTVTWAVSNTDGEPNGSGTFAFTAAGSTTTTANASTDAPATTVNAVQTSSNDRDQDTPESADSVSDAPIWLGRLLSTLGIAVMFGALVLIVVAWPEGPEYVLTLRFVRSVWVLALVGTLLFVVAVSAAVNGDSFSSGLNPASWFDLLDAGWTGRAVLARLVLTVACGWVVLRPERAIDPTTQMVALGLPALAVVTLGLSRTGGDLAALGVVAGIVHALGMAVWLGSLVLLARVVVSGPGEEDLVHAIRGYGRISMPAIVVTILSGLVQMYRTVGGELFSSGHGRVLLLKTAAIAVMIFVGVSASQTVRSRLSRAGELSASLADRLRRAFTTEAAIGVVVLGLSAWMLSLPPGKASGGVGDGDFAVVRTFDDPEHDLELEVSMEPARAGEANTLRVEVISPDTGVTGVQVAFVPPADSDQPTIIQDVALTGSGVAQTPEGSGIPLSVPGSWTLQVTANTPTGGINGASSSFDVRDENGDLVATDIPAGPTTSPVTAAPTTTPTASTAAGG